MCISEDGAVTEITIDATSFTPTVTIIDGDPAVTCEEVQECMNPYHEGGYFQDRSSISASGSRDESQDQAGAIVSISAGIGENFQVTQAYTAMLTLGTKAYQKLMVIYCLAT